MDDYLVNLVERMTAKENIDMSPGTVYSSSQSVSWNAYREAETLNEESYISQLMDYIATENCKKRRGAAYFILGKLLIKFTDNIAIQFYVNRLEVETDKYIIGDTILLALKYINKDQSIDISPIINCIKSNAWIIRDSAIAALAKTQNAEAREALRVVVQLPDHKKNKFSIISAIATLGDVGEEKDIEILNSLLSSRIRDIKISTEIAIEKLNTKWRKDGT